MKLWEFEHQTDFRLVNRASFDGFDPDQFHENCDKMAGTLTIVKVGNNSNIFGRLTIGICIIGFVSRKKKTRRKPFGV